MKQSLTFGQGRSGVLQDNSGAYQRFSGGLHFKMSNGFFRFKKNVNGCLSDLPKVVHLIKF